jgi:hypothetical protein
MMVILIHKFNINKLMSLERIEKIKGLIKIS